jgi:hypothetical protein
MTPDVTVSTNTKKALRKDFICLQRMLGPPDAASKNDAFCLGKEPGLRAASIASRKRSRQKPRFLAAETKPGLCAAWTALRKRSQQKPRFLLAEKNPGSARLVPR